jgi:hypothetical protein
MRHHRFTNVKGIAKVAGTESGGRYRSKLERDGFLRWMLNPDVLHAHLQQPRVINPDTDGAWKRYTGDMLVDFLPTLHRRQLVVEFKYEKELNKLQVTEPNRYPEIQTFLDARNRDFLLQTEKHVHSAGFQMMRFVWDFRNNAPHAASEEILAQVRARPGISLAEALTALRIDRIARLQLIPEVWRLVATHRLRVDFTKILDQTAKLEPGPV